MVLYAQCRMTRIEATRRESLERTDLDCHPRMGQHRIPRWRVVLVMPQHNYMTVSRKFTGPYMCDVDYIPILRSTLLPGSNLSTLHI